jgi:hypothetical protein
MPTRSAKEVIDEALRDNRAWEWLCFPQVILVVVVGLTVLVIGAVRGDGIIALAGGGVTGLFFFALRFARQIREENIKIRLCEVVLTKARTPGEPSQILRDTFARQPVSGGTPSPGGTKS